MKIGSAFLISTVVISACATAPQVSEYSSASKFYQKVDLAKNDRNPAAEPTVLWQPKSFFVKVVPSQGLQNNQISLTVDQIMSWKEQQPFQDTRYEYQEVQVNDSCPVLQCSNGNGQSALWNKFYSSAKNEKANALNQAIDGVGASSAAALIEKGYFHKKPSSWEDFCTEIQRAADNGVIKQSAASTIIYKSGPKNAENLGYGSQDCHIATKPCSRWDSQLVPVPFTNYRDIEQSKVLQSRAFDVNISVNDAKLLPFESENLNFKIDETGKVFVVDENGTYNSYKVTASKSGEKNISINAVAQQRNQVNLGRVVLQDNLMLVQEPNKVAQFYLDVDPKYLPSKENDPQAQLVVDYVVRTCEYGWTGLCGFGDWKKTLTGSKPISQARTMIEWKISGDSQAIPFKRKVNILYSVKRLNSVYFNSQPTQSFEGSNTIKVPKN